MGHLHNLDTDNWPKVRSYCFPERDGTEQFRKIYYITILLNGTKCISYEFCMVIILDHHCPAHQVLKNFQGLWVFKPIGGCPNRVMFMANSINFRIAAHKAQCMHRFQ